MGGCISLGTEYSVMVTQADMAYHRAAEKEMKETKSKLEQQAKVLLLGSGDSGKSTVLKQMRIIHEVPFQPHELEHYRQIIFNNLLHGMGLILDAMVDMALEAASRNLDNVDKIYKALDDNIEVAEGEPYPEDYLEPLLQLWEDPNVQEAWRRGNEVALPENLVYFFPDLLRLFTRDYSPTNQDVLHCRARTTGISETKFTPQINTAGCKLKELLMVDVGGQKSERRKWIHCFQDVTCILFLVSLSGYDQCLVEDKSANQMQDAMTIWDSICHSQWFKRTTLILFMNKYDLFERKIRSSSIKRYFPDYTGDDDPKVGCRYFTKRFMDLAKKDRRLARERHTFVHTTTATNTTALKVVMRAVEE
ncbi:hypothetical protein HGRIS_007361 [Hohenbuehelia grisea]|uniref:Guanine nucleotide-binding protein alpha-2 subunit n=1 Tax=Hohenbuehelia grisea TaxID=104357 RepID=A0ABR3J4J3_9AGAR